MVTSVRISERTDDTVYHKMIIGFFQEMGFFEYSGLGILYSRSGHIDFLVELKIDSDFETFYSGFLITICKSSMLPGHRCGKVPPYSKHPFPFM